MDGIPLRQGLATAAPRLSEQQLDQLRRYVPPPADDAGVYGAALRRHTFDRKLALYWLTAIGATGALLYAIAVYLPASTPFLVPAAAICALLVAVNSAPSSADGVAGQARMSAHLEFSPLLPAEAELVLAFLHRHPEAAEAIAGWRRQIPSLRRHEFAVFEGLFRHGAATVSAREVEAVLDQFDLARPAGYESLGTTEQLA